MSRRFARRLPTAKTAHRRWEPWLLWLSIAYLILLLFICFLIFRVSERWWVSGALSYAPRMLMAVPAIVLAAFSLRRRWYSLLINTGSLGIVFGPIMDLQLPTQAVAVPAGSHKLTVVTFNIDQGKSNLGGMMAAALSLQPDLVCLQNCNGAEQALDSHFADWHRESQGEYFVASKFPLSLGPACQPFTATERPADGSFAADVYSYADFEYLRRRLTAIAVDVSSPTGTIRVFNVHLETPRRGLRLLDWEQVISGDALRAFQEHQLIRALESSVTRAFVIEHCGDDPYLVVGDFNLSCESSFYQNDWGDLSNSYSQAGLGYGYTALCSGVDYWFEETPWLRIDHILVSPDWQVAHADVGDSAGSDHRPARATLWQTAQAESLPRR